MASAVSLDLSPHARAPVGRFGRETLPVFAGLLAVLLAQTGVAGSLRLLRRHFWYDEILTHTLVADPDYGHAMRGLASGIETHPPGLYTILRGFTWLAGGADEVSLRLFAVLSVLAALAGMYLLLRQSFAPLACCAGLLAVWCHPLVVVQTFEARFYAPWLAGVVWFAYFLVRARGPGGRVWDLLTALAAVMVCTVHYFGVIALGLVTVGELLARRRAGVPVWRGVGFIVPGPLALAACLPFLLRQRAAMTVPTWIEPAGLSESYGFLMRMAFPGGVAAAAVVAWLARLVPWGRGTNPAEGIASRDALAGLTGLLLMPAALVALTFAVQPVLQEKYAFPAVAGLAPVAAYLASRMGLPWRWALCAVLCLTGVREHQRYAERRDRDERRTAGLIDDLRRQTGAEDVLFEEVLDLYVVCRYAPDLAGRCYFLDFEPSQLGRIPKGRVFDRDLTRRYAAFYGLPRLKPWDEVKERPRFYLVPSFPHGYPDTRAREPHPGFVTRAVSGEVYEAVAHQG